MTSEYTPRMIELLVAYRMSEAGLMMDPNSKPHDPEAMAEADAEFYRALAAHDAEVAAKAKIELLNELSREALPDQAIRYIASDDVTPSTGHINSWLWMRAAGIRRKP